MYIPALALLWLSVSRYGSCYVQMDKPMAFRNPNDYSLPWDEKDYNLADPLFLNGTNFPCKGYHHQASTTDAPTYEAGNSYDLELMVGAHHGGGTCELSLSYDNGKTFRVFKRFIGGCPVTSYKYEKKFKIPDFAPSGASVIFSWSYHPYMGVRQMWQNCAFVNIKGGKGKEDAARFNKLPSIYRAGLFEFDADCWNEDRTHLLPPDTANVEIEYSRDADGVTPSEDTYPPKFAKGKCDNDEVIKTSWAYEKYGGMNKADCNVAPLVPCSQTGGWPTRGSYIESCTSGDGYQRWPIECGGQGEETPVRHPDHATHKDM